MTTPFDPTAVEIPDDEPRQIVCTGEEGSNVWQPGFGTWEHDEFGMDSGETVGDGERLFVNLRIYSALMAERYDADRRAEAAEAALATLMNAHDRVAFERDALVSRMHDNQTLLAARDAGVAELERIEADAIAFLEKINPKIKAMEARLEAAEQLAEAGFNLGSWCVKNLTAGNAELNAALRELDTALSAWKEAQ